MKLNKLIEEIMKRNSGTYRTVTGTNNEFVLGCFIENSRGFNKEINEMVEKAKDMEELHKLMVESGKASSGREYEDIRFEQAFEMTSKMLRREFYDIRGALGEKQFKTISDSGSVRVGNEGFVTHFHNGRGDGDSRVAVVNNREFYGVNLLTFQGSIQGDNINIYSYDSGLINNNDIAGKMDSGRYGVYTGKGFVVFEKWD